MKFAKKKTEGAKMIFHPWGAAERANGFIIEKT
jgi:hypothetical protein